MMRVKYRVSFNGIPWLSCVAYRLSSLCGLRQHSDNIPRSFCNTRSAEPVNQAKSLESRQQCLGEWPHLPSSESHTWSHGYHHHKICSTLARPGLELTIVKGPSVTGRWLAARDKLKPRTGESLDHGHPAWTRRHGLAGCWLPAVGAGRESSDLAVPVGWLWQRTDSGAAADRTEHRRLPKRIGLALLISGTIMSHGGRCSVRECSCGLIVCMSLGVK